MTSLEKALALVQTIDLELTSEDEIFEQLSQFVTAPIILSKGFKGLFERNHKTKADNFIYKGNLIDLFSYELNSEKQYDEPYVNIDYFRNNNDEIIFQHEQDVKEVYSQPTRDIILQTLTELNNKSSVKYSEPIMIFKKSYMDNYIIINDARLISRIRTICFFHEHLQNHLFYLNIKKIDKAQLNTFYLDIFVQDTLRSIGNNHNLSVGYSKQNEMYYIEIKNDKWKNIITLNPSLKALSIIQIDYATLLEYLELNNLTIDLKSGLEESSIVIKKEQSINNKTSIKQLSINYAQTRDIIMILNNLNIQRKSSFLDTIIYYFSIIFQDINKDNFMQKYQGSSYTKRATVFIKRYFDLE